MPLPSRGTAGTVAVRAGALGCLLLGALDLAWPGGTTAREPLRVVDVSASVGPAAADPDAGTGSAADRLLFADGVRAGRRGDDRSSLSRERTRLAEALREAAHRAGPGPGRIWLVTDGRDTEGGALEAAAAILARGLTLDVSAPFPPAADVGLLSARIASSASGGQRAPGGPRVFAVRVSSSVGGTARVALLRATAVVDARDVHLVPGMVVDVELRDGPAAPETAVYDVTLSPLDGTPDDDDGNDRLTLVALGEAPRVVVFDRAPWRLPLEGVGAPVSVEDARPAEIEAADALVVSGLPWSRLLAAGAERLSRHVLSGGTLLLLGGPDAFGPGGWRGTALEALSPLRSRAPDEGETAVVVALDASGSTGETPPGGGATAHDALFEAVGALVDALPAAARVLVVPFRDGPSASLDPAWVGASDSEGRRRLADALRSVVPAGGTDLPRAVLAAAKQAAARSSAKRRIVILATDGDPDHAPSPEAFSAAKTALAEGLSEFLAIVRGDAKSAAVLETLAGSKDRVARIDRASEFSEALSRLFARAEGEAEVAGRSATVEVAAGSAYGAGLSALAPRAVHRLEAAPGTEVFALARRAGEPPIPFGASRALGAGRVVALAWGPGFEAPEGVEAARAALAPLIARLARESDRGLSADGDDRRLLVRATAGRGTLAVRRGPDGLPSGLLETAPGLYAGPWPEERGGSDGAALFAETAPGAWRPVRLPARPPSEHRASGIDAAALDALASAGGGRRLAPGERPLPTLVGTRTALAPFLLLGAIALLLLDRRRAAVALTRAARAHPSAEAA